LAEQVIGHAELIGDDTDPGVEIGSAERQPALQGDIVAIGATAVTGRQPGRRRGEFGLGRRHAGSPVQQVAHAFVRPFWLLVQPADRRRRRRQPNVARIDWEPSSAGSQQGGLADAVRPDDADPTTRGDEQVDVVEHRMGTTNDGDVGNREGCGHARELQRVRRRLVLIRCAWAEHSHRANAGRLGFGEIDGATGGSAMPIRKPVHQVGRSVPTGQTRWSVPDHPASPDHRPPFEHRHPPPLAARRLRPVPRQRAS